MTPITDRLLHSARALRDYLAISRSGLFDAEWYARNNSDVAASGRNPLWHYVRSGAAEGRAASRKFDTRWYRDTYLSAFPSGVMNPLVHFETHGRKLGLKSAPARDGKRIEPVSQAELAADVRAIRLAAAADDELGKAGTPKLGLIALGDSEVGGLEHLQDVAEDFAALGGQTITLVRDDAVAMRFVRSGGIIRTDGAFLGEVRWAPVSDVARRIRAPRPTLFVAANPDAALSVGDRLKPSGARLAVLIDERLSQRPAADTALLFEACDALVFSSPAALAEAHVIPGLPTNRCLVEPFRPETTGPGPADTVKPPRDHIVVAGYGDDPARDGLDLFVAVAARVAAKLKSARFVWFGALPENDRFVAAIREDIRKYGLEDAIAFLGERRRLAPVLAGAHVFACLARDNLSVRPLRAAARTGTPVVCFAGATAAESTLGDQAVAVPFGRVEDAAKAILRLAKESPRPVDTALAEPLDLARLIETELGWARAAQQAGE